MKNLVIVLIVSFSVQFSFAQGKDSFTITFQDVAKSQDSIEISYEPIDSKVNQTKTVCVASKGGSFQWQCTSKAPVFISVITTKSNNINSTSIEEIRMLHYFEPGDNVVAKYQGKDSFLFLGKGCEKNILLQNIRNHQLNFQNEFRNKSKFSLEGGDVFATSRIADIDQYQVFKEYVFNKLDMGLRRLENNKGQLSPQLYREYKLQLIREADKALSFSFSQILFLFQRGLINISPEYLTKIFDADFNVPDLKWFRSQDDKSVANVNYIRFCRIFRNFNFLRLEGAAGDDYWGIESIKEAKKIYKGAALEKILLDLIRQYIIRGGAYEEGFPPAYDLILDQYYSENHYPEYVAKIKEFERSDRLRQLGPRLITRGGGYALSSYFSLPDENGKIYDYSRLIGKTGAVVFWRSDKLTNGFDTVYEGIKKKIYARHKDKGNLVIVNIAIDTNKNRWLKAISDNKLRGSGIVNLWTTALGQRHPLIKGLLLDSLPSDSLPWVGDLYSNIYSTRIKKMQTDGELFESLEKQRKKEHIEKSDGPYIFHLGKKIRYFYFDNDSIHTKSLSNEELNVIKVGTDQPDKTFSLPVQSKTQKQPSVFSQPPKIFSLSDIEGNFAAFRKLLQNNGIINEEFSWIFGKGHLVFAGDMFDRGDQVTECLWLVYSLEEQAKASGGMVHFILGNHEIMNLQGNHNYVVDKYKKNAQLMGKTLTQLYNEDSELGRWLRSKNIVEKIGDLLFMHGGVSSELNNEPVTIAEINDLARPHYADTTSTYKNKTLNTIMSSEVGPFWFRGYYNGLPKESMIDSTFQKFDVKHIVTGHTIVADVITAHYGGKLINTDVQHASGKSEALLIEGRKFYRVNTEGKRVLLFKDDENDAKSSLPEKKITNK